MVFTQRLAYRFSSAAHYRYLERSTYSDHAIAESGHLTATSLLGNKCSDVFAASATCVSLCFLLMFRDKNIELFLCCSVSKNWKQFEKMEKHFLEKS